MKQETNFEIGINLCLTTWIYKIKERIQKSKETEDSQYIYQNELVKACFQHDIACEDFKDLARTTTSDKILGDKAFSIVKNPKNDGYQRRIASLVYVSIKKLLVVVVKMRICQTNNQEKNYTNQLLKNSRKVKSPFIDNICGVCYMYLLYLADMQLISKFNKGISFLLRVFDTFSKYAWGIPFKKNSFQLKGQRVALGIQRFSVRVPLLPMCGGELSAVIVQLMSKCL